MRTPSKSSGEASLGGTDEEGGRAFFFVCIPRVPVRDIIGTTRVYNGAIIREQWDKQRAAGSA